MLYTQARQGNVFIKHRDNNVLYMEDYKTHSTETKDMKKHKKEPNV